MKKALYYILVIIFPLITVVLVSARFYQYYSTEHGSIESAEPVMELRRQPEIPVRSPEGSPVMRDRIAIGAGTMADTTHLSQTEDEHTPATTDEMSAEKENASPTKKETSSKDSSSTPVLDLIERWAGIAGDLIPSTIAVLAYLHRDKFTKNKDLENGDSASST